jgi:CRISPR-associated exonuclease Cas4
MGLCTGILEYPKHKRRETVELLPEHEALLAELPTRFQELAAGTCPPPIEKRICKSCAFAEYCYAELEE